MPYPSKIFFSQTPISQEAAITIYQNLFAIANQHTSRPTSSQRQLDKHKSKTHLTASGQMLSEPLESQMVCSRTGVPVCAALTM